MIALGSLGYARLSCSILIIVVISLFVPCRAQSQMPPISVPKALLVKKLHAQ